MMIDLDKNIDNCIIVDFVQGDVPLLLSKPNGQTAEDQSKLLILYVHLFFCRVGKTTVFVFLVEHLT